MSITSCRLECLLVLLTTLVGSIAANIEFKTSPDAICQQSLQHPIFVSLVFLGTSVTLPTAWRVEYVWFRKGSQCMACSENSCITSPARLKVAVLPRQGHSNQSTTAPVSTSAESASTWQETHEPDESVTWRVPCSARRSMWELNSS